MTQIAAPQPKAHPIGTRLRNAGITEIVIVDDAYDPPTLSEITDDDVAKFWAEVRNDQAARTELAVVRDIHESIDIDNDVISVLWASLKAGRLQHLQGSCQRILFREKLKQLADVESIRAHLRELGFDPATFGRGEDPPLSSGLVFLDYVLDSTATMDLADLATKKAIRLYEGAEEEKKPFIVLMSDRPDAAAQQEKFREKSNLLGGLFGFISKEEATASEKLFLRLGSWGIGNTTHQDLQRFVSAIVGAVDEASDAFKNRIRALGVQDYAFIQRLSLHEDGHPLGDYVLWLFEASLGYGLRSHDRVKAAQDNLDKLRFEKYLPCQNPPSQRLADFFLSALTEPAVTEMTAHPHEPEAEIPLLAIGDIFVNETEHVVFMVVTAACDLAFSPSGGRACDPTQPVYLAPGKLQPIQDRGDTDSDVRTELISYNEKPHRILWDYAHVESQTLKNVWKYLLNLHYQRRWRLRLPYALQVQQAFANHITRIGMPVPPPIFRQADVGVYCKGADGNADKVGDVISDGVVLIHAPDGDHFLLTVECVTALMQRIDEVATAIETQTETLDKGDKHYNNKLKAEFDRAGKLRAHKHDSEIWLAMLETPIQLPKPGEKCELNAKLLWVYRERDMNGPYSANTPLAINIVPATSAAGVQAEAAVLPSVENEVVPSESPSTAPVADVEGKNE